MYIKLLLTITLCAILAGCGVNTKEANKVLEAQGMTEVQINGYSWFGCGEEDVFRSKFTAKSVVGEEISGSICGGILKGYTIRF